MSEADRSLGLLTKKQFKTDFTMKGMIFMVHSFFVLLTSDRRHLTSVFSGLFRIEQNSYSEQQKLSIPGKEQSFYRLVRRESTREVGESAAPRAAGKLLSC